MKLVILLSLACVAAVSASSARGRSKVVDPQKVSGNEMVSYTVPKVVVPPASQQTEAEKELRKQCVALFAEFNVSYCNCMRSILTCLHLDRLITELNGKRWFKPRRNAAVAAEAAAAVAAAAEVAAAVESRAVQFNS